MRAEMMSFAVVSEAGSNEKLTGSGSVMKGYIEHSEKRALRRPRFGGSLERHHG